MTQASPCRWAGIQPLRQVPTSQLVGGSGVQRKQAYAYWQAYAIAPDLRTGQSLHKLSANLPGLFHADRIAQSEHARVQLTLTTQATAGMLKLQAEDDRVPIVDHLKKPCRHRKNSDDDHSR